MRRLSSALGLATVVALLGLPLPAFADACGSDPSCVDPGTGTDTGSGFPVGFLLPMLLVLLVAIGTTVYRVSVARSMAEKSGLDPGEATRVALLDDDGLSATYIASQMHGHEAGQANASTVPGRSTADRLRELDSLRTQGLVTEDEYAQRRSAILGEV